MKPFYILLLTLITSCSGTQLFMEARTTYNVPLKEDGDIDTSLMEYDARNVSGFQQFHPQIRLTYRQYLFDGKKTQIKNIFKRQLKNSKKKSN